MVFEPDLMRFADGTPVKNADDMRKRRIEILNILQKYAYGEMPAAVPVTGRITEKITKCCSGDAVRYNTEITCKTANGVFTFPLSMFIPNGEDKKALIIVINFRKSPYDEYIPVEEIIDNGFALAQIYYEDITADNADFGSGIAKCFPQESDHAPAKISLWAWGISRALDYLLSLGLFREDAVGVIGHSRLGKTALWCGANDERFRFVCSNCSGCMGAAYARSYHDGGEPLSSIAKVFPFWFCKAFQNHCNNAFGMPFDQHLLAACIAPRYVLVNSASGDAWADPVSEQNACIGASPAWQAYGFTGYQGKTSPYGENEGCLDGGIAYYKRSGIHYLGRKDWNRFMKFMRDRIDTSVSETKKGE